MQRAVERHPAKMFANPMVEIQARPARIELPQPQKLFNLNCCSVGRGGVGRRGGDGEVCAVGGSGGPSLPAVEPALGVCNCLPWR